MASPQVLKDDGRPLTPEDIAKLPVLRLTPDGGVVKKILRAGEEGVVPPEGKMVRCHYVGRFPESQQIFDSSRRKGREFQFVLGASMVIAGWDIGVASMKRGELSILTCTSQYAYGPTGAGGVIPPNATLEFELELIGFDGEPGGGAPKETSKCVVA